jgi:hypothetical protein
MKERLKEITRSQVVKILLEQICLMFSTNFFKFNNFDACPVSTYICLKNESEQDKQKKDIIKSIPGVINCSKRVHLVLPRTILQFLRFFRFSSK